MPDIKQEYYDIVLIQPPLFKEYKKDSENEKIEIAYWKAMEEKHIRLLGDLPTEASYAILSIGSYLKSKSYNVKILDFHMMDFLKRKETGVSLTQEEIEFEIKKNKSKFYGITVLTIADKWSNSISNLIRNINSQSYIFWGGYYPTKNYNYILDKNRNIDFIVRNEGELIINDILNEYKNKSLNLSNIKGISYRVNNKIIANEDYDIELDIKNLPNLNYNLYDCNLRKILVPRIYTARGCNNDCIYCTANNSNIKKLRKREVNLVVDEIQEIYEKYGKKFFVMGDLEFLMDLEYSKSICQEIIDRCLHVKWWCQIYPKHVDNETIELMKKAGNIQIAMGIESKSEKLLKEVNKEVNTDITIEMINLIKKHGIQIQAYIMVGLPGDTFNSVLENIEFIGELVKEELIDATHLAIMTPYPGSEIYNNQEKYGVEILTSNSNEYYMNCDFLGASIPTYNIKNLTNLEIYSLWLLGMAHLEKCFKYRKNTNENYKAIYDELNLDEISILDRYYNLN